MNKEEKIGLHETNKYKDLVFPVGVYTVTKAGIVPDGRGYKDLHWHEELQFTMVLEGTMKMRVNTEEYEIKKGEAIYINRNLLHITTFLTDDGKYASLNFPDKLLGFFSGSRMEQSDVLPFTVNYLFPIVVFKAEMGWQKKILQILKETIRILTSNKQKGQEYLISMNLTHIWYLLISNVRKDVKIPSKSYVRKQQRIQSMLSYIHENYMNDIKLEEIAGLVSISVGECCRCFQQLVGTSPNKYLLNYRIAKSMELLNSTALSVTEIAFAVGFNDFSYFIQYFKKSKEMTPTEYRKQKC
ncbi:AraC family transcriptional regulator [Clostridium tyrobutyricum]|uniref:AraC family transcriptional regulator n=1 Tax=Clostridium tyrobutyricum TaxID=1519 RepID=UPI0003072B3D|nr:AraC family transcriptional regulator [Clostridium tyrobutyricum]